MFHIGFQYGIDLPMTYSGNYQWSISK